MLSPPAPARRLGPSRRVRTRPGGGHGGAPPEPPDLPRVRVLRDGPLRPPPGGLDLATPGPGRLAPGAWRSERSFAVCCPAHEVRREEVPFARAGTYFTRDFEDLVGWLATTMDKTAVCRLVRIDWDTVGRTITRVAISREGQALRLRQAHGRPPPTPGLPDPAAHRRRVHAQRPCDLPNRLARSHQPHRLDPNRWRRARPRPATLQAARPARPAWPVRLRYRPTSAPAPSPSACWHPMALPGSARLAAYRLASPWSARRACRWRRWAWTRSRQGGWAGGRQATPAPQRPPRPAPAQGGGQPRLRALAPRT